MEFIKNFSAKQMQLIKFIGVFALGAIALMVLSQSSILPQFSIDKEESFSRGYTMSDGYYDDVRLSVRNVEGGIVPPSGPDYTPGADTEDYEVKQYSVSYESRTKEKECDLVRELILREDVIFENTNEYESGCSFSFKVKKESVEAVLEILKSLDPKEVNENSYTIKREVTDYTSEIEILEQKLAVLEKTLNESLVTYDLLITRATAQGDIASLAQLTDSKLSLIERLTMSKIETSSQLERINRAKAEALDQLAYTQFYVSVYENKLIDGEEISNSWITALQALFTDINKFAQEVSLGFVALLFMIVKYALYGTVLLFVARFGFNFAQKVWQDGSQK